MLHGLLNFDVASAAWDGSNLNRTAEQLTMDIVKRDLETTNDSNITTGRAYWKDNVFGIVRCE